jgi:hypothetical protein
VARTVCGYDRIATICEGGNEDAGICKGMTFLEKKLITVKILHDGVS